MTRHAGLRCVALLILASIGTPLANADMIKYSTVVKGGFVGDTNITGALPKFDPSLFSGAELTGALLEYDMNSRAEFGVIGQAGLPDGQATFRHDYFMRFRGFGFPFLAGSEDIGPVTAVVGQLNPISPSMPHKIGSTTSLNLNALTGTGNVNIDGSNVYTLLSASLPPGATMGIISSVPNIANVSITYFYNAVPEPGAFVLLAVGIVGAGALSRLTRGRRRDDASEVRE